MFIGRYCDVYKPCCTAAGLPGDGAACRTLFMSTLAPQPTYDATAGESCLAALQETAGQPGFCEGDIATPSACAQAFGGAATGACVQDSDCPPSDQGDVRCVSSTMSGKVLHQCQIQTRGQLGSTPCLGSVRGGITLTGGTSDGSIPATAILCDAADGLRCDGTACVALATAGEVCSGLSEECIDGDFCDVTVGQCAARKPIGTACIDQALECADGSYCDTGARPAPRSSTSGPPAPTTAMPDRQLRRRRDLRRDADGRREPVLRLTPLRPHRAIGHKRAG